MLPAVILLGMFAGCAVPQTPPGGPPDTTPPRLVASSPAASAVNVDAQEVSLTFDEYVDAASFARALSVVPEPERPIDIRWRRRTATLRFPEPLRPNTTYVLTLDTALRDARGVSLSQPLTIAFSTGAALDAGQLSGRVVRALDGTAAPGVDVYLYARPDSLSLETLPDRPLYRTQTDADGRFTFSYLRQQPYAGVALTDRNRNRQRDTGEAVAVPPRPILIPDTTETASQQGAPWVLAPRDTTAPSVLRVEPLSRQRATLRFSEPVRLLTLEPSDWSLADSATGVPVTLRELYQPPDAPASVAFVADPMAPVPHELRYQSVVDTSGTAARGTVIFIPPAEPDTLTPRFLGFMPQSDSVGVLMPREQPALRFSLPVDSARLATAVSATDSLDTARPFTTATNDGTTYRLRFTPPLALGQTLTLRVSDQSLADTVRTLRLRRLSDRQLGAHSGVVEAPDRAAPLLVELYRERQRVAQTVAGPDGTFRFELLPEGTYRFRAFSDLDGDGQWSPGSVAPYAPPEPLVWSGAPTWRARWDAALADTIRISPP